MMLSENRFPLFGIMLTSRSRRSRSERPTAKNVIVRKSLEHDFCKKPVPTFLGHALGHHCAHAVNAAHGMRDSR
jgi:hypothetical protein